MLEPLLQRQKIAAESSLLIKMFNGRILSGSETCPWVRKGNTELEDGESFLIGRMDGEDLYLHLLKEDTLGDGGDVRGWLNLLEGDSSVFMARALILGKWLRENRYCGTCGKLNVFSNSSSALQCPECGTLRFPVIAPAVITLVSKKDQMLLGHNAQFRQGMYSLFAGFNEAGESLEETVRREVREEVGIEVKNIRYFNSQSWPMPNSLMVGFTAEYAGGEPVPDGEEITDAAWFGKDNLPELPGKGSIAHTMIAAFLDKI